MIVVSQALAAIWFYRLFREVDEWAAAAMGIWGTVNATLLTISAIAMKSAISRALMLSTSIQDKTIAIQIFSSIINSSWSIGGLFFGLWIIPMGYLVIKSKRMPVWLGRTLIIGGIGYLVQTFLNAMGITGTIVDLCVLPASIGEFWMIFYLLTYGYDQVQNESLISNTINHQKV
jgi:hypothetical protein